MPFYLNPSFLFIFRFTVGDFTTSFNFSSELTTFLGQHFPGSHWFQGKLLILKESAVVEVVPPVIVILFSSLCVPNDIKRERVHSRLFLSPTVQPFLKN